MNPKTKSPNREVLKELILNLGGEVALKNYLLQFYERMSDDVMIGFFFAGKDLHQISTRQAEFILSAAGLLKTYEGKGPSTAHVALPPILSGHFDRRLVLLREVLERNKVDSKIIDAWIQFEEGFRAIVVAGPSS